MFYLLNKSSIAKYCLRDNLTVNSLQTTLGTLLYEYSVQASSKQPNLHTYTYAHIVAMKSCFS